MIRRELTTALSDKLHLPASTIAQVLELELELLLEELVRTGRLEWRGFGTFDVRAYPARKIHNPATGHTIELPARRSVSFKPGTQIRSKLNAKASPGTTSRRPARRSKAPRSRARP